MADHSLPSSHHPFADLFALLPPDSIPKWTSVVDLLRKLSDQEPAQFEEDDAATESWLEKLENARDLLRETEEQLVELYFDRHIHDLAEAGSTTTALVAIGDPQDEPPPELALGAEVVNVARQQDAGSLTELVDAAEVEICRRLLEAVDFKAEVHELDIAECENAVIRTVRHPVAAIANSGRRAKIQEIHIEECANARDIQAASHEHDGARFEAVSEVPDLDVGDSWRNSRMIPTACACSQLQAGGVECEGNAETEICQSLIKCVIVDWDEGAGSGQGAGEEEEPDEDEDDEGNCKDVEMMS